MRDYWMGGVLLCSEWAIDAPVCQGIHNDSTMTRESSSTPAQKAWVGHRFSATTPLGPIRVSTIELSIRRDLTVCRSGRISSEDADTQGSWASTMAVSKNPSQGRLSKVSTKEKLSCWRRIHVFARFGQR